MQSSHDPPSAVAVVRTETEQRRGRYGVAVIGHDARCKTTRDISEASWLQGPLRSVQDHGVQVKI